MKCGFFVLLCFVFTPYSRPLAIQFPTPPPGTFIKSDQNCISNSGQSGICTLPHECPLFESVQDLIRIRPKICEYIGKVPIVCCTENDDTETVTPSITDRTPPPSENLLDCGLPEPEFRLIFSIPETTIRPTFNDSEFLHFAAVAGVNAEVGKWPWIALLGIREARGFKWICGGTLVNSRWVVTAAHCLKSVTETDLNVRLGEYDLSTKSDGDEIDIDVSRIIRHPSYHARQNDIALLQLKKNVEFSKSIKPVCLPDSSADFQGQIAELAGWGYTEYRGDETPNVLQQIQQLVVPSSSCETIYRTVNSYNDDFPGGFQGTKLCANDPEGGNMDACSGDSGGPLQVNVDGRYQLIGVVSTGVGCGNPQFPGIYTKVSSYVDWIKSEISSF